MAKKRGRTPRFRDVGCPNARCKLFGKLGAGTVVSNGTYFVGGTRVRKFICRHCGQVFNSRARTPFRWLHTPRRKGLALSAGDLSFRAADLRPWRTSWLIVGIETQERGLPTRTTTEPGFPRA